MPWHGWDASFDVSCSRDLRALSRYAGTRLAVLGSAVLAVPVAVLVGYSVAPVVAMVGQVKKQNYGRFSMARYILLTNWTEQGIKNVKDSPKRLDAAKALAKKLNGEIKKFYMTTGAYDMVLLLEVPTDEVAAKFALTLGSGGNVRTTTLKAFSEESYRAIVGALA
jgi:uncharacterized protein with GYD domain